MINYAIAVFFCATLSWFNSHGAYPVPAASAKIRCQQWCDHDQQLLTAVQFGDTTTAMKWIQQGANPLNHSCTHVAEGGLSAYHTALYRGQVGLLQEIFNHCSQCLSPGFLPGFPPGVPQGWRDNQSMTVDAINYIWLMSEDPAKDPAPVFKPCLANQPSYTGILPLILVLQIDPQDIFSHDYHIANGNVPLLARDIPSTDVQAQTIRFHALDLLCKQGAHVNAIAPNPNAPLPADDSPAKFAPQKGGLTALSFAVDNGLVAETAWLLTKGAFVSIPNADGEPPLLLAVKRYMVLLQSDAYSGETRDGLVQQFEEIIMLLQENGADFMAISQVFNPDETPQPAPQPETPLNHLLDARLWPMLLKVIASDRYDCRKPFFYPVSDTVEKTLLECVQSFETTAKAAYAKGQAAGEDVASLEANAFCLEGLRCLITKKLAAAEAAGPSVL